MRQLDFGTLTDRIPAGKVATSVEAFDREVQSGRRENDQQRIHALIRWNGETGVTSHEACNALGISMQTMSARLNDLWRAGLIDRRGDRRGGAMVWREQRSEA